MFENSNRLNSILKKMKIVWYCRISETKLLKLFFSYRNSRKTWSWNVWKSTTSWYNFFIISHINCTKVTMHTLKVWIVKIRFWQWIWKYDIVYFMSKNRMISFQELYNINSICQNRYCVISKQICSWIFSKKFHAEFQN